MLRPSTYTDVLSIIGREDLGYNSTPPDGTCGYTAPLQAMLMMEPGLPVDAVLPAAKASLPFVLRDVGIEVCENPALRDSWRSPENRKYFFTELNKMVDEANKLEDKTDDGQVTKVTDDQVKDLIKRTGVAHGPWIFTHLLNALAIVLKRDIIVVAATSVTGCRSGQPECGARGKVRDDSYRNLWWFHRWQRRLDSYRRFHAINLGDRLRQQRALLVHTSVSQPQRGQPDGSVRCGAGEGRLHRLER